MYKILISGYYGFNNIGDESILTAVVGSMREKLDDVEITVLSHDPESTAEKYDINSCDRKSIPAILSAIRRCDLLVSGGGSLLQDTTSKRSILYYLFIMAVAKLMGKPFFIYSQGIGPINSKFNRRLTAIVLKKARGIVVRDASSKQLLTEIGLDEGRIVVTADPVLGVKPVHLEKGKEILLQEGFKKQQGSIIAGFAIKERRIDSNFMDELEKSMERLITEQNAQIVLIPFHYSEDMAPAAELERRLSDRGLADRICTVRHKHLTEEMMSIIGNMDILVGVRLHSLIHAAIMGIPMIGISYDPKINSFLHSIGMKAACTIYDLNNDFFVKEFCETYKNRDKINEMVSEKVQRLIKSLATNEEMIKDLMKG
ncbi:MAG: polysaccharide pyruvyl transferase CsaB [Eubacteriales bacterium]|nr:polysaccharide pyruvyl transferase CsaB [Eubacteriales bacterium]MDD4390036.1 polysaccharide pyruvyl transferase CsaB [Eubacteriales bacterium]